MKRLTFQPVKDDHDDWPSQILEKAADMAAHCDSTGKLTQTLPTGHPQYLSVAHLDGGYWVAAWLTLERVQNEHAVVQRAVMRFAWAQQGRR